MERAASLASVAPVTEEIALKLKKNMTEVALAANRANAQKSTGPGQPEAVKRNALKNGFRSKSLFFENEEEQKGYEEFAAGLWQDQQPQGILQEMLVDEMAISWWKFQLIDPLLLQQIRSRTEASAKIYDGFLLAKQAYLKGGFAPEMGLREVVDQGWQCDQLVMSAGGSESPGESADDEAKIQGGGRLQLQLRDTGDKLMRYANTWRRDFYRALAALVALRSGT